jgi:hypothetical protein
VRLRYDPARPDDVRDEMPPDLVSAGLIVGGLVLAVALVGNAIGAFESKTYAAASGIMSL